jgi:hypothetical protein
MPKPQDILGQKFGRLTVICATAEKDTNGRTLYKCQCDCGKTRVAPAYLLLRGSVISCGCAQVEARKNIGGSQERHGWTRQDESERIKKIYTRASGVYQRGENWVAQIKFSGTTYHILSTPDREEAFAARQEIVQMRIDRGDDATIEYLEQIKEARKAERCELMKRFGGFPTREEMAEMRKNNSNSRK